MLGLTRWVIAHRRVVVVLWVALAVGVFLTARAVGTRNATNFTLPKTDSQRALDLLKTRFPAQAGDSDQIVFHTRTGRLTNPQGRQVVLPLLARIRRLPHVAGVASPYSPGADAVARDGTIGFATVTFDERANELPKAAIQRVIRAAEAVRSPQLQVELGGQAIQQTEEPGLGFATIVGLAAAVAILLVSFGSLWAMGLPIATALLGLGAGVGLIGLTSHLLDMVNWASELALMIGLGVGIDYALFIVTRYRDSYRANGGDTTAAVETAMNTAGRAILFAGATVVTALLGLVALGVRFLDGVAIGASLAVLLVLAASLTLLPALLASLGGRIGRPARYRLPGGGGEHGFWARWIAVIQRHALSAALAATALMLLLAAPALGLRFGAADAGNNPTSQTSRRAYDLLAQGFGKGFNGPLLLAVHLARPGDPALDRFTAALRRTRDVASVAAPRLNRARDTAAITVYPASSPQSEQTTNLVDRLRSRVLPPLEAATGATVYVGGATATELDFSHVLAGKLPLFIAIVVVLSALLLLVVFRSLLIPLGAAVMNLLSIGAAVGVVQAVFERGWGSGLIGVEPGPIEAVIPVMVFAIVFGLSMDYEVFLVSRIHEEWQNRRDSSAAVREGLIRTGRVITAAAAVMVAVFSAFATNPERILKLFGLAMATAVFLDALVVRVILLPALLELLGRRTWAFPSWFDRRLPRLAIEPQPAVPPAAEPAPARSPSALDPG